MKSLKTKLILLILAVIIVSNGAVAGIAFVTSKKSLEASVDSNLTSVASEIASLVNDDNEKVFSILRAMAAMPSIRSEDFSMSEKDGIISVSGQVLENCSGLSFFDEDGSCLIDGWLVDCSKETYVQEYLKGHEYAGSPILVGTEPNWQLMNFYSVPVYNQDNDLIGGVVAVMKGERLSEMVTNITVGKDSHPTIIDMATGAILGSDTRGTDFVTRSANPDTKIRDAAMQEFSRDFAAIYASARQGASGIATYRSAQNGQDMVAIYRPVGKTCSWAVICAAPYRDFYGALSQLQVTIVICSTITLAAAILFSYVIISMAIKPLKAVKESITDIASGNADLTKRIDSSSQDEIGDVVKGFNKFTEKLQTIIGGIQRSRDDLNLAGTDLAAGTEDTGTSIDEILSTITGMHSQITTQASSVQQTAGAVNEIASNIESLEQMIENQSSGVSEASSAVEQMIGNITSVNQSVDQMALSFAELSASAKTGVEKQADVNGRIEQIRDQSETLQEANMAIAAIAEQTNLLAMNAAIEAAHAGEAGKGFSVVADEIRKLSETSSSQSKTIGEQLNNIRDSIQSMVSASAESTAVFQNVDAKIMQTDELVRQIKAAMQEQNEGSRQISNALHTMNDSTIEVRTASKEMSEGNKAILDEVHRLQELTSAMQGSMEEMSHGANKIHETGQALGGVAAKMRSSIEKISAEIDQFSV